MTIPIQIPKNEYIGNGVQDTFAYTFSILANEDITVTVDGILQVLATDYNLSNQTENGGDIVFVGGSIPADTLPIIILRETPQDQDVVYTPYDPFPAKTHEGALDKITMLIQEHGENFTSIDAHIDDVDIHFSDAPADGEQYSRRNNAWEINAGGSPDATHLRLDAANGPLTGPLTTQSLLPDGDDLRNIGAVDSQYERIFGEVGIFINANTNDPDIILPPDSDNVSGIVAGSQQGPGQTRHVLGILYPAAGIMASAHTTDAAGVARVEALGNGSVVFGSAIANGPSAYCLLRTTYPAASILAGAYGSGNAQVLSRGLGSSIRGVAWASAAGSTARLDAYSTGGDVFGAAVSYGTGEALIYTYRGGASAGGFASQTVGNANNATIESRGYGSWAHGYARSGVGGPARVTANANGCLAFGFAGDNQVIEALAVNAAQFGVGSNNQIDSLQVGSQMRMKGTVGPPTIPHDGDMWVNNNFTYIQSNGLAVQIT